LVSPTLVNCSVVKPLANEISASEPRWVPRDLVSLAEPSSKARKPARCLAREVTNQKPTLVCWRKLSTCADFKMADAMQFIRLGVKFVYDSAFNSTVPLRQWTAVKNGICIFITFHVF
jgi:hypothetical protein